MIAQSSRYSWIIYGISLSLSLYIYVYIYIYIYKEKERESIDISKMIRQNTQTHRINLFTVSALWNVKTSRMFCGISWHGNVIKNLQVRLPSAGCK